MLQLTSACAWHLFAGWRC